MIVRVATVLSARDWEAALVTAARSSGSVRLVKRAYQPEDLDGDAIDVIVAGGETAWVTPSVIANWRRRGLQVIGIYPRGDSPAAALLEAGGADPALPDDTPPEEILLAARNAAVFPDDDTPGDVGKLVAIVSPPGGAGCTEVAIALATAWSRTAKTLLVDCNLRAPSLAVRLGLPARPDLTDAASAARTAADLPTTPVPAGGFAAIVGSHRLGEPPLRTSLAEDVLEAAKNAFPCVVADVGEPPEDGLVKRADHAIVVLDSGAVGLVRGARMLAEWAGPPPALVLNRVPGGERRSVTVAARRWTGLEPAALIPFMPAVRSHSRRAGIPGRGFRRHLGRLEVPS